MSYQHRYCTTRCPSCDADLTADRGIIIDIWDDRFGGSQLLSRLDEDGLLIDAMDAVAAGFHAGTRCAKCGSNDINDFEDVNDKLRALGDAFDNMMI